MTAVEETEVTPSRILLASPHDFVVLFPHRSIAEIREEQLTREPDIEENCSGL